MILNFFKKFIVFKEIKQMLPSHLWQMHFRNRKDWFRFAVDMKQKCFCYL